MDKNPVCTGTSILICGDLDYPMCISSIVATLCTRRFFLFSFQEPGILFTFKPFGIDPIIALRLGIHVRGSSIK